MLKRISINLLAFLFIFNLTNVSANTSTASISVDGGTLSLDSIPTSIDFGTVQVDGLNWQWTAAGIGPIRVIDGRGTGEGWNVSISATPLTEVGGQGLVLSDSFIGLYAPTSVTPVNDTNSTPPILSTGLGKINEAPFTIATADLNTGMGSFDLIFPGNALELNIHPSEKVVDYINFPAAPTPYQTTITWSLNNTP